MERIDRAYEILSDPVLLSLYDGSTRPVPYSSNVERLLQKRQFAWTEWPGGTFFPQWRPPPPGAWPPRSEYDAPQQKPSSQERPHNTQPRWELPTHSPQPEKKPRVQEQEVPESEGPPCMMYGMRLMGPHPRLRKAEETAGFEVDVLEQRRQGNRASLSTQWPEPPWPWLKQRPRK